ncbi:hypothetical protein FW778_00475 [Ginsengibacter hankyongi]|uniref:Uncharacterized protein n=1 Tax=Ginsengibacter hankyongi TaxID=2607284 RepID=A0A5J5IHL0_9BACT|nr:hypothetical protein [Ginsengibacter hankyongi]KAA9040555.1 hypothetical protein FW778_00475 [Ginsengibacter hankyongi]
MYRVKIRKMTIFKSIIISFFSFVIASVCVAQNTNKPYADFFVSTIGNDRWSGKLSEPNADRTDGPFASIKKAKAAVKSFKNGVYRDIFILIRGGEYHLAENKNSLL